LLETLGDSVFAFENSLRVLIDDGYEMAMHGVFLRDTRTHVTCADDGNAGRALTGMLRHVFTFLINAGVQSH
jgi:hypothetical protein